jgi:DNA primase
MDAKEEVKRRLSVEDVLTDYVELKRAGRNFKALSPWSNEKTPSLMVSPEKQIWHDFSSNRGGDMFSFVMEMDGIDFKEALEVLARKAGVDLSQYQQGDGTAARKKKRLYEAHELAVRYYHQTLAKNPSALEYVLQKRAFQKSVVSQFQIGYAPAAGRALTDFLKKRGFSLDELKASGLTTRSGSDMFRGRMVLPLADGQGRVVGFTGRILTDDKNAPKYLNTPQTLVYDKGRQAYGLHLAKEAIREKNSVIIVEGNLDVVASHQAGVANVVAAAGTALTTDHLRQLSRLTNRVKLAFDSDDAGIAATERAIGLAQGLEIELEIISVPDGKDPDDLIKQDPKLWREAIENSKYVMDWLFDHYQKRYDLTSATGKRSFTDRVLAVLARMQDPVEQEHYSNLAAEVSGVSPRATKTKLEQTKKKLPKPTPKKSARPQSGVDKTAIEDTFLAINAANTDVRDSLKRPSQTSFSTDQRRLLFEYLLEHQSAHLGKQIPKELKEIEDYVNILLLKAEELYGSWSSADLLIEAIGLARRVVTAGETKTKRHLSKAIREAEAAGDAAKAEELLKKYQLLLKEEAL